jgi:signal transduction histidine kinase
MDVDRVYFVTADPLTEVWQVTHASLAPGVSSQVGVEGTFDHAPQEMKAIRAGEPFAVTDVATDPRIDAMRPIYLSLGIQSILLIPVLTRGQLYGVLGFDLCREKRAWRAEEISLADAIAHQLELALENTRLFEEAHQRADELAAALARLEELDRLKDEFIQNVSHELRSPLALIRGYAEMLDMGELGRLKSEQQKPVTIIARRARMLSELVQDITLLLEAEVNPPEPEPVHVNELVEAAVEDFQVASREADLTLQAEVTGSLPPVFGSPSYLRRVLDNLLSNAVKFTPQGGRVVVRAYQEQERVVLQVSDTGIGIPSSEFTRIFDRFYQVDGSARRRYGGVGLGLALVKDITHAYGGTIEIESEIGEGTTFTISLPVFNPL